MKKNKNAFTLIELLAVIVILAVIALIATPIILGIVEDAKKDAFLRSVELLVSTTDIDIANKTFEEEYTYTITEGNISNMDVSIKNTSGMNGTITYDMNGKEVYAIHNGVYCVMKTSDMNKAEISDYNGDCKLEVATSEKCFAITEEDEETMFETIPAGTIIDYYDYEDNDSSNPACPRDVIVPKKINGIDVVGIGYSAFSAVCEHCEDYNGAVYYDTCKENAITSIKLPNSVITIGENAFTCHKLSGELDLSNLINLTSIRSGAFSSVSTRNSSWITINGSLTNIKLPRSIESIGDYAFYHNALSGELDLSHLINLTSIGYAAFEGDYNRTTNQITNVKLPSSVTNIGDRAFRYNKLSGELDLSMYTNLTSIGNDAFSTQSCYYDEDLNYICNGITNIKIPSSVMSIGNWAFDNNALTSVTFYGRSDLTGVTIGNYSVWGWADGYDETNGFHFVNE